ncbi:hypothetical protein GCM10018779_30570 [Streptomyces griseocarneus]|nr:hypothetical protein GCM10018779_30570 [Streptomyces griseocarneus]
MLYRGRFRHTVARGNAHGTALHLMGLGGDEMSAPGHAWLGQLLRQRPWTGMSYVRAVAAQSRRPLTAVCRDLLRYRTYEAWLLAAAAGLGTPPGTNGTPRTPAGQFAEAGWWAPVFLPEWAGPEAVELVRKELRRAAGQGAAPAPDRGRHRELATIHTGAWHVMSKQSLRTCSRPTSSLYQ